MENRVLCLWLKIPIFHLPFAVVAITLINSYNNSQFICDKLYLHAPPYIIEASPSPVHNYSAHKRIEHLIKTMTNEQFISNQKAKDTHMITTTIFPNETKEIPLISKHTPTPLQPTLKSVCDGLYYSRNPTWLYVVCIIHSSSTFLII